MVGFGSPGPHAALGLGSTAWWESQSGNVAPWGQLVLVLPAAWVPEPRPPAGVAGLGEASAGWAALLPRADEGYLPGHPSRPLSPLPSRGTARTRQPALGRRGPGSLPGVGSPRPALHRGLRRRGHGERGTAWPPTASPAAPGLRGVL